MEAKRTDPFPITGYEGILYFCDREQELASLKNLVENFSCTQLAGTNVLVLY